MPSTTLLGASRAKSTLAEPLKSARILAKPNGFVPLRTFNCGSNSYSEKYINKWVQETFRGGRRVPGRKVLVLEDARGRLIGIGKFRAQQLHDKDEWTAKKRDAHASAYYIHIVALDRQYRGQRLSDGSRLGDILLDAMLEHIGRACGGELPRVWALIRPENKAARSLFEQHGFRPYVSQSDGEIIYDRPWRSWSLRPGNLIGRIARLPRGASR